MISAAETGDAPSLSARGLAASVPSSDKVASGVSAAAVKINARGKPSSDIHVRAYDPSNWFTASGVLKKRREIEAKGLPSFFQWRFITLTVDPSLYGSPLEAFLTCRDDLRKFTYNCRQAGLWTAETPWCWKLEFHKQDGWPHWHFLVGRTAKFSLGQLETLRELWKHGRTSVEMVRNDDFLYSFKYAFKPVIVQDEDRPLSDAFTLPEWFMDYMGCKQVKVLNLDGSTCLVDKPVTFQKVRFWQTSKGFYTGKPRSPVLSLPSVSSTFPNTVRENMQRANSRVQVVSRKRNGAYLSSAIAVLSVTCLQFWTLAAWHGAGSNAVFLGVCSAVMPKFLLEQKTKNKWTINQHLETNRLTQLRAGILQREGINLQRC